MSRLRHSAPALLRVFQISQSQIFLIVEGHNFDRYVYGRIAQLVCVRSGFQYQVISARELPGATGGKRSVLRFFRYLRRFVGLTLSLGSRRRAVVFYLDKDVDDLTKSLIRHPHVCYTANYDLEGHLFMAGDLSAAIAAALSLDPQTVVAKLTSVARWRHQLANRWLGWTSICLYVKLRKLATHSYGSLSQVNSPLDALTDDVNFRQMLIKIEGLSGSTHEEFAADFGAVVRLVRKLFDRNLQDVVFKGKWYFTLMDLDLRKVFAGHPCNFQQVPARIGASLLVSIDYSASWAEAFRIPLQHAIALIS